MKLQDKLVPYLEYCTYRKELDQKTVKAYRIDLNQYFTFVACEEPDKEKIEEYITELHKKYKQKQQQCKKKSQQQNSDHFFHQMFSFSFIQCGILSPTPFV